MDAKQGEGSLGKWVLAGLALWGAYSWGEVEGRRETTALAYTARAAEPYTLPPPITTNALPEPQTVVEQPEAFADGEELASYQPEAEAYTAPAYSTAPPVYGESPSKQDARFAQLYQDWNEAEAGRAADDSETLPPPVRLPSTPARVATGVPRESSGQSSSYTPAAPIYTPPAGTAAPRYGCSESGSCYGDISPATGRPKTVYVPGHYKSNGKYVRGYYRSN